MFIVIHCGGMPFNGDTIETQSLGGSETAAYYVAKGLAKLGHHVTIFTNSQDQGEFDGVAYRWAGPVSEQYPLGEQYHQYSVSTPHDLNITQRHPFAFHIPVAAKVKSLWFHDVPMAEYAKPINQSMIYCDLVFAVSEWQKQKIVDTWGVNPDVIKVVNNGIDLEFIDDIESDDTDPNGFKMVYSSRPERGLETLVKSGGIMEKLYEKDPSITLAVCGYDNVTPQMKDYYSWLYARCAELPNVEFVGALTKSGLYRLMHESDLLCYPTTFEETSCITAMEAMACGLPILSTNIGALPETCEGSGSILGPTIERSSTVAGSMMAGDPRVKIDEDGFIDAVMQLRNLEIDDYTDLVSAQHEAANKFDWSACVDKMVKSAKMLMAKLAMQNEGSTAKHLLRNSDIYALKKWLELNGDLLDENPFADQVRRELDECYAFMSEDDWGKHYEDYYSNESNRGAEYGPEEMEGNARFDYVASRVGALPAGSLVLDYGCAHGHYTINMAKKYPGLKFIGVDINADNIEKARAWALADEVTNVEFYCGQAKNGRIVDAGGSEDEYLNQLEFNLIIIAEVLEHVAHPHEIIDSLSMYGTSKTRMLTTTPYGPWEAMTYKETWPFRAHVHHFERADLHDMFGHLPGFGVVNISSGRTPQGEPLGSYVCEFQCPANQGEIGSINYSRKLSETVPRQTLSVCMIAKNAEDTIKRTLKSVVDIADEIIVAIDLDTTDETLAAISEVAPDAVILPTPSPLAIGFDEARNNSIDLATGDWILWVDADEVMHNVAPLSQYLQNNGSNGYAILQHHFSIEPAGLLKTDHPCRIFRNNIGVKFFGMIHEHPEVELNKGVPFTTIVNDVAAAHYGYTDEETRRRRFSRNLPLLLKDREKYPDRTLGQFLYLRDLYQLTRYELEERRSVTTEMVQRVSESKAIWEDLVANAPLRFAVEALEWYGAMNEVSGIGYKRKFVIGTEHNETEVEGNFANESHALLLLKRLFNEAK